MTTAAQPTQATSNQHAPDQFNALVGREVRAWMGRLDLNQKDLSVALGYKQPMVSQRLKGKTAWRMDELFKIASYMGITLADLLGDSLINARNPHLMSGEGAGNSDDLTIMSGDDNGRDLTIMSGAL